MILRVKIIIRGAVQGVGFRPFVYRLASEMNLKGFVLNSSNGVIIEAEGEKNILDEFLLRLEKEKPKLAIINSLEFSFFISFLAFLFQAITGFGMYSAMSDSFFPKLFAWIVPLMGGDFAVRQWHHMMMWFFIIFAMIHVYLVFYHDYVERRGLTSSMIGGWKFIEKE